MQFKKLQKSNMNFKLNIKNEYSALKTVVIGIAGDRGDIEYDNNPKISKYLQQGNIPNVYELTRQVDNFAEKVAQAGVQVLRPENVPNQDQIFTRDIAFVIGDTIIKSNMKKDNRRAELEGIKKIFDNIPPQKILTVPHNATIEGGDVIIHNKYIFVGLSARTNYQGFDFIKQNFPEFEVIPLQLYVSDNAETNVLHLDCTFQPVGSKYAILYENGFVHYPDELMDIFGTNNIIKANKNDLYNMNSNIFSISPELVVSDLYFSRINKILNNKDIETIEIDYQKVSRLGGLFRCSTLPLERE